jgi:hypothetical protein
MTEIVAPLTVLRTGREADCDVVHARIPELCRYRSFGACAASPASRSRP